mmetsp:Transcript_84484/g.253347  ORF Transcript_84484/g.253347 Transcript_84484/m.253347 type:complete len:252 (+) Transcript_84484:1452-2207(+)
MPVELDHPVGLVAEDEAVRDDKATGRPDGERCDKIQGGGDGVRPRAGTRAGDAEPEQGSERQDAAGDINGQHHVLHVDLALESAQHSSILRWGLCSGRGRRRSSASTGALGRLGGGGIGGACRFGRGDRLQWPGRRRLGSGGARGWRCGSGTGRAGGFARPRGRWRGAGGRPRRVPGDGRRRRRRRCLLPVGVGMRAGGDLRRVAVLGARRRQADRRAYGLRKRDTDCAAHAAARRRVARARGAPLGACCT